MFVNTETSYRNESTSEEIASAEGTIVRTTNETDNSAMDRSVYEYSDAERSAIVECLDDEITYIEGTRDRTPLRERVVGDALPEIVRDR